MTENETVTDDNSGNTGSTDLLVQEGDIAGDYLERLLDIADVDGDIDMDVEGDRAIVAIVGEGLDALVGPNGQTLEALQELTRLAVVQQTGVRSRLMLDIGGYRARRKVELTEIGARTGAARPRERRAGQARPDDARSSARSSTTRSPRSTACTASPRASSPSAASWSCRRRCDRPELRPGTLTPPPFTAGAAAAAGSSATGCRRWRPSPRCWLARGRARPARSARGPAAVGAAPAQLRRPVLARRGRRGRARPRLRRRPARPGPGDPASRRAGRARRVAAAPRDVPVRGCRAPRAAQLSWYGEPVPRSSPARSRSTS